MRTGLEPNKSFDMFSSTKATNESSNPKDWLGLKDESSEEDELPRRTSQKVQPVITTLVKKPPIAPVQEASEPPKKSVLDSLLDDDRRALTEKTTITPIATSKKAGQDFWLDELTNPTKHSSTTGISKTSSLTDNQQVKSSTKPLFDTKTDTIFNTDPQISTGTRTNSSTVNVSR
jgi:hypothetical protein